MKNITFIKINREITLTLDLLFVMQLYNILKFSPLKKGKVFYGYYHSMWCQLLSTTCSNGTEVAQWGASRCSRPQLAVKNGVRDCRSNWQTVTPHPTQSSTTGAPRIACCKFGLQITRLMQPLGREHATSGMPGSRTACAATQGIRLG